MKNPDWNAQIKRDTLPCVCVCVRGWIKRSLTCWFAVFNLLASILMRSSEVTAQSGRVRKTSRTARQEDDGVCRPLSTDCEKWFWQIWWDPDPISDDCNNNTVGCFLIKRWKAEAELNSQSASRFPQKQSSLSCYWPFFPPSTLADR